MLETVAVMLEGEVSVKERRRRWSICCESLPHQVTFDRLPSQRYQHEMGKDTLEMKSRHPHHTLGSWPLNINYIPKCCIPKTLRIPNSFFPRHQHPRNLKPKPNAPNSLLLLPRVIPNPMTNPQILLKQVLRKLIKPLVLRPQPVRSCNPTHTSHFMHIDQRPTPRKERVILPIQEHHSRYNPYIMLPSVAQLVPPFTLDDLGFVDLVDSPEVGVGFVEEDGLEDMLVVFDGCFVCAVVLSKLVLVVCAVEGHFDLPHVFGIRVRVVHWSVSAGFAILAFLFVFGKGDLLFLLFILWLGAEVRAEAGLVVFLEIFAVRVGDSDVVEEAGATEDEALFPGCCLAHDLECVVGEDAHD